MGTGAGFPGLVLKILVPSLDVTLLDALGKRVNWLNELIETLGLSGVRAIHGRAEECAAKPPHRDAYDLVTARAVAELRLLEELCLPFTRPGGLFLAMKAEDCGEERAQAAHAVRVLRGRLEPDFLYDIPDAGITRRVIRTVKTGPTPRDYPRRWNRIQKEKL